MVGKIKKIVEGKEKGEKKEKGLGSYQLYCLNFRILAILIPLVVFAGIFFTFTSCANEERNRHRDRKTYSQ